MTRAAVLLALTIFLPAVVVGQSVTTEPALAYGIEDAQLAWVPCPDFIPRGCELAVLHGDPAGNNADILFRVPGNFDIPSHWHTSAERMVLISGELQVTYDGQPPMTLKRGMYAYGPAKLPHAATCAEGDTCVLFIAFESPIDAVPTGGEAE